MPGGEVSIPKAKVYKTQDGVWISSVYYANKYGGVNNVIFMSKFFSRALRHALTNA